MSVSDLSPGNRQRVLGGVLAVLLLLSGVILFEVLGTIVFAMTVAFVLTPIKGRLREMGLGQNTATIIVSLGAVVGVMLLFAPLVIVLMLRLQAAINLIAGLPETISVLVLGVDVEIPLAELLGAAQVWIQRSALAFSRGVPTLLLKLSLFGFLVYAIIQNESDIAHAVFAVVPPRYREIAHALHERARETLYAIYILQGATSIGTVIAALPLFYFLGYDAWIALATLAGILQFIPVLGPSILIAALTVADVAVGNLTRAVLIMILGGIFIAAAPDVILRPRLAAYTIRLSSGSYFIGFVGGILTIGALGVIVGPLVIALVVEAARLLAVGFDDPSLEPQPTNEG